MLKKALISIAILGMFGLLGFAFAQPVQDLDRPSSNQIQRPTFNQGYSINPPPRNFSAVDTRVQQPKPTTGWVLRMNDGEVVNADLANEFEITLKTEYGKVSLGSDNIISLRVISQDQPVKAEADQKEEEQPTETPRKIVVATTSGDIISGESDFESLQLKLSWGTATAKADSIDFICNRKFGVMTIVNNQSSPAYMLSGVQLERHTSRIVERARSTNVIAPGRLVQPSFRPQSPRQLQTLPNPSGF